MAKEVIQEMHVDNVEIKFINRMLRNLWLNLALIFLDQTTL